MRIKFQSVLILVCVFALVCICCVIGNVSENNNNNNNNNNNGIIPDEFHGTWLWERGQYGHTITMTIDSTKITSLVVGDPDTSKNGTVIYTVTNVTKGSTVAGWTAYNVTISGMGTLVFEVNSAGTLFRDINGTGNTYPRVYTKKVETYLWSEIDVVRTITFSILGINDRVDFNPFSLSSAAAQQYWNSLFSLKNSLDEDKIRMTATELRARVLPEIGNNTNLADQLMSHLEEKGNILYLGGEVKSPVNPTIPEEGIVFVVKE